MVGSMGKRQILAAAAGGAAALFAVGSMFLWGLWEAGGQGEPAALPGEAISPSLSAVTAPDTALPGPPGISAASACVMTGSGTLLYEKDGDSFRSIASTTKIMTALLTLELSEGQLDEPFTVGDEVKVEGSALGIKPGAEGRCGSWSGGCSSPPATTRPRPPPSGWAGALKGSRS